MKPSMQRTRLHLVWIIVQTELKLMRHERFL